MSHIIVKDPEGAWYVWSTIVDDWLIEDATRQEVFDYELEKEREEINRWLDEVDEDGKAQFTRSYEELVEFKEHLEEKRNEE